MNKFTYLKFAASLRRREITHRTFIIIMHKIVPALMLFGMVVMVITGMILHADRIDNMTIYQGLATLGMIGFALYLIRKSIKWMNL